MKWIITILAVFQFGFMAFDGTRALTVGDYVRPESGAYAGQLGPWSGLAESAGIDPEGRTMKWIFVLLGAAGLAASIRYFSSGGKSRYLLLLLNVLSLWYLVPGTLTASAQIFLLLTGRNPDKQAGKPPQSAA